jgi:hypothetical protein
MNSLVLLTGISSSQIERAAWIGQSPPLHWQVDQVPKSFVQAILPSVCDFLLCTSNRSGGRCLGFRQYQRPRPCKATLITIAAETSITRTVADMMLRTVMNGFALEEASIMTWALRRCDRTIKV